VRASGACARGRRAGLREWIVAGRVDETAHFFRAEYALNLRIATYPKPIVVVADGVTMGGGIGLAGHAAVRVVTERSRLAMPETRIGFTPDVGGSWLLAHAPGRLGEYLALTGEAMDAADALAAGFADALVPSERIGDLRAALADRADPGTRPRSCCCSTRRRGRLGSSRPVRGSTTLSRPTPSPRSSRGCVRGPRRMPWPPPTRSRRSRPPR
jgi:enoyl-CoA hydratase/carnithine racemase